MKIKSVIIVVCIFIAGISCSRNSAPQGEGTQTHEMVVKNQLHSYELFLPAGYDAKQSYPLIVSFDSHGNGSMAIEGFKKTANRFGFIVVGSNMIKNGIDNYESLISELINDVKDRYSVDSRLIYTAGFSGGARMALYYGIRNQLTGVVACGAAIRYSDLEQTASQSYIFNIAGSRDFNNLESTYFPGSPESSAGKYMTLNFTGVHEWPSEKSIGYAVEFLYVRSVIDKIRDERISVSDLADELKKDIDSTQKAKNFIETYKLVELASKMFAGSESEESFTAMKSGIEKNTDFIKQNAEMLTALQMEQMLQGGYNGAFKTESIEWWKKELSALNDTLSHKKPGVMLDMLYRVKGYVGIMCFAFINQAIEKNDNVLFEKILGIYELAEPQNPDLFYYKSLFNVRMKKTDSVEAYMQKAFALGFEDKARLQKDFPAEIVQKLLSLASQK